jgi:alpha/beta hydrolase family protein
LGTYLGWNITAGPGDTGFNPANPRPFHASQVCNYVGGMVPFAMHKTDRLPGDPCLSLEERYHDHEGYVAAVRAATDNAACQGYLFAAGPDAEGKFPKCATPLQPGVADDWKALVNQAISSDVLN